MNSRELRAQSKRPANQVGGGTVAAFFEQNKAAMAAVLPKHVTPDRMLRIALGALRTTPALMECTTESLFAAVIQCSQLGLEPNTPMGHIYLIPYKNRKMNRTDCQVIPGYRGLIDLARRSGQIVSLSAHAVYSGDEFEFSYGLDETLHHVPARSARGEMVGVYAIAQVVGGGHQFEVMWDEQIRETMAKSQSGGRWGPWKDHYEEMARKTAVRRLFKYLPVSIEIAQAVALDEANDRGAVQDMSGVLTGDFAVVEDDSTPAFPTENVDDQTKELFWTDSHDVQYDAEAHAWDKEAQRPAVDDSGAFVAKRGGEPEAAAPGEVPFAE